MTESHVPDRIVDFLTYCLHLSAPIALTLTVAACGSSNIGNGGDDVDGGNGGGDAQVMVDAGVPGMDAGGEPECVFTPTGQFNPDVECSWTGPEAGSPYQGVDDVVMTPVVINLTDDNGDSVVGLDDIPDIAFISYSLQNGAECPAGMNCGCCNSSGVLRVVSGGCQNGVLPEHYSVGANEIEADTGIAGIWLDNSSGLAVGDIDADGSPDIVATTRSGGTIAFERDGTVKWYQPDYPTGEDYLAASQPALADLDADGMPEVIQGRVVLNGEDGSLQWQGLQGLGTNGFMGPVVAIGDLDLDAELNVLAGPTSYDAAGAELWSYAYATPISDSNCQHSGYPCDGFTATGNFDNDDFGELVIVRAGVIYLINHDGSPMELGGAPVEVTIPSGSCARNEGGPPTVADFDGDGEAEIGVAGSDFYIVADLECLASPLPAQCSDPGIRWKVGNEDCSSRVTGSSVFDFDGDGRAEVVYADEVEFRILDGVDGSDRLNIGNHSHTRLEMPIVADVDNDGNSEIVFVENAHGGGLTQGVRVWGDATDSWVPTRRIWNQHAYHVTNVGELGEIPQIEPTNWLEPTVATLSGVMNNFRQNLPEDNAFAAPDLTVALSFNSPTCSLLGEVCNVGDIVAGAGAQIAFYDGATQQPIACVGGPAQTALPLAPGACESVSCELDEAAFAGDYEIRACVDNLGFDCTQNPMGANNECVEDNNRDDQTINVSCAPIE